MLKFFKTERWRERETDNNAPRAVLNTYLSPFKILKLFCTLKYSSYTEHSNIVNFLIFPEETHSLVMKHLTENTILLIINYFGHIHLHSLELFPIIATDRAL